MDIGVQIMSKEKRLQKYDEGIQKMHSGRDEREKALDCMVQHIETFHEQAIDGVTADFGKPCYGCPYIRACSFDWLSIMKPLLDDSIIKIQMGYPVLPDIQDSFGDCHAGKEDTCQMQDI